MRIALSCLCLSLLVACAPAQQDPNADYTPYDSRVTTGSNIPRKGSATTVDKSVVQDAQIRQNGSLQR